MNRNLFLSLLISCPGALAETKSTPAPTTAPPAAAPEPEKIVIEDFHELKNWTPGNQVKDKTDYFLASEKGKSFLRAHFIPGTTGQPIHKSFSWDTVKYPILTWSWRVNKFPEGAKILDEDKSDAASQLYVFWNNSGRAYALKYFWSQSDPIGTYFNYGRWNPLGRYYGLVIRMGGKIGVWETEKRNLIEDYKKAYSKEPPGPACGIALLTDGDQTRTEPEADYGEITASKN